MIPTDHTQAYYGDNLQILNTRRICKDCPLTYPTFNKLHCYECKKMMTFHNNIVDKSRHFIGKGGVIYLVCSDVCKEKIKRFNEMINEHISDIIKFINDDAESEEPINTESKELINNENYLYIIKEREFIKTNENVYKIGRTNKGHYKRFTQYPKGSVVMALIKVPDAVLYEGQIKKIFNKTFKQRKDIGSEYYEEDFKKIHKLMIDIVYKLNAKYEKEREEIIVEKENNIVITENDEIIVEKEIPKTKSSKKRDKSG